ncbi:S-layer homology domain-containing protein [Paenibacillus whitsoniae]|uniref:S-layer homology domain-containing protein n=1 Tax=Paenibacillus whitsoniae TaxID=2496558 RepID=UPI0013E04017|nr:S-layer homology domain-containing protein [Paenibacillus whitsoniae]
MVPSTASVKAGESVTFTVAGKSLADVYGAEFEFFYDPAKLKYTGVRGLGTDEFVMAPTLDGNKIELVYTRTKPVAGLTGDRNLFTVTFQSVGTGAAAVSITPTTVLNSQSQLMSGISGGSANVSITSGDSTSTSLPNGGSTSTPPPSNPATPSTPPAPVPGVVSVEATLSGKGVVNIDVDSKVLLAAAVSSLNKTVLIQLGNTAGTKALSVTLPAGAWNQAGAATGKVKSITFETGIANVSIDTKLIEKSPAVGLNSKLQLTVAKVEPTTLPADIRQTTGSQTVYDFSLSLDGQKITKFNGEIKVELPYTLAPGEKPNQVVIYYLADDGTLEVVKNGRYNASTGMVEFKPKHFSKYTANYASIAFRDMDGAVWAKEAVLGLAAREVIQGRSEGSFVPGGDVTRAEFVQMLAQLFDLQNTAKSAPFTDVTTGTWYYGAIASAQQAGLVQGKADGSFGVNDRITREDMAVLIYRAWQLLGAGTLNSGAGITVFQDQKLTSDYAKEAVAALQYEGLMNGVTEGFFDPKGASTRAQAAMVLYRLYQRM